MLTLVEPDVMDILLDRPNLGCAMLIAACHEKGIETTLIKGQTRYLKDIFINDSEELWGLMKNLKKKIPGRRNIPSGVRYMLENGVKQLKDESEYLYNYVITDKDPRHYYNSRLFEQFSIFNHAFSFLYYYSINTLKNKKLKIIDRYVSEIMKTSPRYIGFSLQKSFSPISRLVRKRIKELTGIPIIVGGSLTPFMDLSKIYGLFKRECFDYLVVGEGEKALPSLIEALENKEEPRGIANVFYRKAGKLIKNDFEIIDDLDSLPYPDYSQFDLDLYVTPKRILPLQVSRGCSWRKCAYCAHHSISLGVYKTMSAARAVETIEHLKNTYDSSHFIFHDEELPPAHARRISETILHNKLKGVHISTYARPVNSFNNDLFRLMYKAGFSLIYWGVESGSQRILDLIEKGTKVSSISRILKESAKNKIANLTFIFFGFPGETWEEAEQTVQFLKDNAKNIENVTAQAFNLVPNSPIGRNPGKWGVKLRRGGKYQVRSGMDIGKAKKFLFRFKDQVMLNIINITSGKFKYFLPLHNSRILHFLNSSHEILCGTTSSRYIESGKLNKVFPVIIGEIYKKGKRTVFFPINIKETNMINWYFSAGQKILDGLETRMLDLSDGALSIKEIAAVISKKDKKKYGRKYIDKKCTEFFREMFLNDWALGFAKSWSPS